MNSGTVSNEPGASSAGAEPAVPLAGNAESPGRSESREDEQVERIAIVMEGKYVSPHFGRAAEVMLIDVVEGEIKDREIVVTPPLGQGALPALLKRKGVRRLVTGSIGATALKHLEASRISVYTGACGSVEDALGHLLSGTLLSSGSVCEGGMGTCAADGCGGTAAGTGGES